MSCGGDRRNRGQVVRRYAMRRDGQHPDDIHRRSSTTRQHDGSSRAAPAKRKVPAVISIIAVMVAIKNNSNVVNVAAMGIIMQIDPHRGCTAVSVKEGVENNSNRSDGQLHFCQHWRLWVWAVFALDLDSMTLSRVVDPLATYVAAQYLVVGNIVLFGVIICVSFSCHDWWLFGDGSGFHMFSFFTFTERCATTTGFRQKWLLSFV